MASLPVEFEVLLTLLAAVLITGPWVYFMRRSLVANAKAEKLDVNSLQEQLKWAYSRIGALERNVEELQEQSKRVPAMETQIKQLTEDNLKLYRQVASLQQRLQDAEMENNSLRSRVRPQSQ